MNLNQFLPEWDALTISLTSNFIVLAVTFLMRQVGFDVFSKLKYTKNFCIASIRSLGGLKTILVYADPDDDGVTLRGLRVSLENENSSLVVQTFENPEKILEWPRSTHLIHGVVLFITDVTPLSSDEAKRDEIQNFVKEHVMSGGTAVLGHDVLYRRSRNKILQKLAGCKATRFAKPEDGTLEYKKLDDPDHGRFFDASFLKDLPDTFEFADREYVTGEWMSDVKYLYVYNDEPDVPLVTVRTCGDGHLYWFNTGDHNEHGPPQPLSDPDPTLITLLSQSLSFQRNEKSKAKG